MTRIKPYERKIEQKTARAIRKFSSHDQERARPIIKDMLETARDAVLLDRQIWRDSSCDNIMSSRQLFEEYTRDVLLFTNIAADSDAPIATLRVLQKYKHLVGTFYFDSSKVRECLKDRPILSHEERKETKRQLSSLISHVVGELRSREECTRESKTKYHIDRDWYAYKNNF